MIKVFLINVETIENNQIFYLCLLGIVLLVPFVPSFFNKTHINPIKMKILAKISKLFIAAMLLFVAYAFYTETNFWGLSNMELYSTVTFIAAIGFIGFIYIASKEMKDKRK